MTAPFAIFLRSISYGAVFFVEGLKLIVLSLSGSSQDGVRKADTV
jgi:hypothetical protein